MHSWALLLLSIALLSGAAPARAADETLQSQALRFAGSAVAAAPGARVQVEVGTLDPRLKLAPCDEIQPYVPANARLWGRSRIGLRCAKGTTRWNVYLPITVKVFAPAVVAARALPAGAVLEQADLAQAEVDLAEDPSPALRQTQPALGRALERPLPAGGSLRQSHLKPRQWFAAGETVTLVYVGEGFSASTEAQALSNGLDGQAVRVRTPSGKIVTGRPVGERRVEVRS